MALHRLTRHVAAGQANGQPPAAKARQILRAANLVAHDIAALPEPTLQQSGQRVGDGAKTALDLGPQSSSGRTVPDQQPREPRIPSATTAERVTTASTTKRLWYQKEKPEGWEAHKGGGSECQKPEGWKAHKNED